MQGTTTQRTEYVFVDSPAPENVSPSDDKTKSAQENITVVFLLRS